MLRQVGLISAGCQPWNLNMVSGTGSRFAYCSTMAVYIYEFDPSFGEYKLTSINAEHAKTLTCLGWNKSYPDFIATASSDRKILVWDVSKRRVVAHLDDLKVSPNCISWVPGQQDSPRISYIVPGGNLETWNITTGKTAMNRDVTNLHGEVTVFAWHHTRQRSIAFGFRDGSLVFFVQEKQKLRKREMKFSEDEELDSVLALSWDPLSNEYLLVANKTSGLRLIDTSSCTVITTFCLPSKAVSTCTFSWIHSAPGMFLTGDKETGVLRLWSVGRNQPLESFKLKQTGFNCLHVLDSNIEENLQTDENVNQGSMRKNSTSQQQSQNHSVPPAGVVCTFRDGGVGLYNLQRRKWQFLKEQGHIETIFDCKFKPDDPRTLATASFDGTIKVWSTKDMMTQQTSAGNEGVIYSLSWAPGDLNCIACATRRGGVFVWDLNRGKVIRRFSEHGQRAVYCVSWNQRDSHRIASSSEDCTCIVRRLDGKESRKFQHPAPVYGCDWSVFNKDILATGCEDGVIRIWNVTDHTKCISKLKGHEEKVFHVRWHPLLKDILCSGSDDCTIRVWSIDQKSAVDSTFCIAVLTGHTAPVRGLTWNYEIPYLLISGSWDSTIRLWDARGTSQQCLEVVKDHGADVYGLTSHPMAPFLVASSSRDSTLRLWSLAPAVSLLFLKIIANHPLSDIVASPEDCMQDQSGLKLAGIMSKQIVHQLEAKSMQDGLKLRWFSELFCVSPGLENMWDIACCANGSSESSLSSSYKHGIMHMSHATKYKTSEAQELELSAVNRSMAGNKQQDAALEKASDIYLKLGNLRRHCESLKAIGRWETALALAPGVSLKYWMQLVNQYAKLLETTKDRESISYNIALGNVEKSVQFLCDSGEYQDALLVAQSAVEGRMPSLESVTNLNRASVSETNAIQNGNDDPSATNFASLVTMCCNKLSQKRFVTGDPHCAVAHLLSNNDVPGAISCLVKANELALALCLGRALKHSDSTSEAAELLCRKLEGEKRYFFAIEMARLFTHTGAETGKWIPLHASCARYNGDEANRKNLYEYASLMSPKEYHSQAIQLEKEGKLNQALHSYLLSIDREKGLELGIKLLCVELKKNSWTLNTNFLDDLGAAFCVSSRILVQPSECRNKNKLLTLSAYLAALQAVKLGYMSVVAPLFEHAVAMAERLELMPAENHNEYDAKPLPFPLVSAVVREELNAWKLHLLRQKHHSDRMEDGLKMDETMKKIMHRAGAQGSPSTFNETVVAGSGLPSHSDVHVSSLTNTRINGPTFYLEDSSTVISLNEAIMWAKVNQFSPTGSGERIYPF